jgi:predicted transcriptional regulator
MARIWVDNRKHYNIEVIRMSLENVLGHKTRRVVYNYISKHPGVSFGTIMGILDLTEGTLRYHLNYLERGKKILSKSEGKHRCYYSNCKVKSSLKPILEFDLTTLTKPQQRILTIIQQHPGIPVRELVKLTKLNKRDLQYNLKKLRDEMVIWKVGNGRNTRYEYMTKDKLKNELFKLLILKFLKDEIDKETYLFLKEELEKEG